MGVSFVYSHIYKGKTHEEIIDSVLDKEYKGIKWFSDSDLSKKLGKSEPYVKRHLANGESYEDIIDHIINNKINTTKEDIICQK